MVVAANRSQNSILEDIEDNLEARLEMLSITQNEQKSKQVKHENYQLEGTLFKELKIEEARLKIRLKLDKKNVEGRVK